MSFTTYDRKLGATYWISQETQRYWLQAQRVESKVIGNILAATKKSFFLCPVNSFCTNSCYFNGIWVIHVSLLLHYNHDLEDHMRAREQDQSAPMC